MRRCPIDPNRSCIESVRNPLRAIVIVREYAPVEREVTPVRDHQRFVFALESHHRGYRSELFLIDNAGVLRNVRQQGRLEEGAVALATADEFCTTVERVIDEFLDLLGSLVVDQRAVVSVLVEEVAGGLRPHLGIKFPDEIVVNVSMCEHAADR